MKTHRLLPAPARIVAGVAFWLLLLFGLTSGPPRVGLFGAAQAHAQVTTQTAIGATYEMPLGWDLSDPGASPQVFHTLIPIGDAALAQIKNQSAAAVQRPAEAGPPAAEAQMSPRRRQS